MVGKRHHRKGWLMWAVMVTAAGCGLVWAAWQYKTRLWIGEERFTVVNFVGKTVEIESFDPVTKSGIRLVLPDALEIETVNGRGKWRVGVLAQLAAKFGEKWAADSITAFLGIGYSGIGDNLRVWDRLEWWGWGRLVRWKDVDLGESEWVREVVDVDGVKVLEVAPRLRSKIEDWFLSSTIANEQLSVTVVNTTGVAGLGARVAQVVESAGVRVVAVNNDDNEIGRCEVTGNAGVKETVSVRWIMGVFGCGWQSNSGMGMSELTVAMGRDYRKWWLGGN